jgi:hypothetical protein
MLCKDLKLLIIRNFSPRHQEFFGIRKRGRETLLDFTRRLLVTESIAFWSLACSEYQDYHADTKIDSDNVKVMPRRKVKPRAKNAIKKYFPPGIARERSPEPEIQRRSRSYGFQRNDRWIIVGTDFGGNRIDRFPPRVESSLRKY